MTGLRPLVLDREDGLPIYVLDIVELGGKPVRLYQVSFDILPFVASDDLAVAALSVSRREAQDLVSMASSADLPILPHYAVHDARLRDLVPVLTIVSACQLVRAMARIGISTTAVENELLEAMDHLAVRQELERLPPEQFDAPDLIDEGKILAALTSRIARTVRFSRHGRTI